MQLCWLFLMFMSNHITSYCYCCTNVQPNLSLKYNTTSATMFGSLGPKVHVRYCHHITSIVCNVLHFNHGTIIGTFLIDMLHCYMTLCFSLFFYLKFKMAATAGQSFF